MYLDIIVLVKRYFEGENSAEVVNYWTKAEEIVTSYVIYAEAMASFWRKKVERYLLRGFDVIHLASAKVINECLQGNLVLLCFDRRFTTAAHNGGLKTFPKAT